MKPFIRPQHIFTIFIKKGKARIFEKGKLKRTVTEAEARAMMLLMGEYSNFFVITNKGK